MIPNDPVMLLSFLNTQLRDNYDSLGELCSAFNLDKRAIEYKMGLINYFYDINNNQFK